MIDPIFPEYPIQEDGYPTEDAIDSRGTTYTMRTVAVFEDPKEYIVSEGRLYRFDRPFSWEHTLTTEQLIEENYGLALFELLDTETAAIVSQQIAEFANRYMNENHFMNPTELDYEIHCEYHHERIEDERFFWQNHDSDDPYIGYWEADPIYFYTRPFDTYTSEHFMNIWRAAQQRD